MNTSRRMVRVVQGHVISDAMVIERVGEWAVVELPTEEWWLVHLTTGLRARQVDPEHADRIRPALRELAAAVERFDLQSLDSRRRGTIAAVLTRHGLSTQPGETP